MAAGAIHNWQKTQEIRPGTFSFLGDGSVRLVGPSLSQIVHDVALHTRHRSISDVVVGRANAAGWKELRPDLHSWAYQLRRPRLSGPGAPGTQGIIAILIGLLLPATELDSLKLLRPYLAPGARLHLVAGVAPAAPSSFNGYEAGFTGGVFVGT
jgi:hypothetical protein